MMSSLSIGIGLGSMASPPVAGLLFEAEPVYLLYLVGGLTLVQGLLVTAMWNIAGYACTIATQHQQQALPQEQSAD